ncbi:hypothetical protein [Mariprofundus erugo]|nr:hypothetical protein [Mariprofundus erugo]
MNAAGIDYSKQNEQAESTPRQNNSDQGQFLIPEMKRDGCFLIPHK